MTLKKNRLTLYTSAIIAVLVMVFGIGLSLPTVRAADDQPVTAIESAELQPAGGAEAYHDAEATGANTTHGAESGATEQTHSNEETGVIGMFGLNWKLFVAQLVNFGIVVFVLWKWVFKPVTSGLSERTEKIENSLKEAEQVIKDRNDFEGWKQDEIAKVRTEASGIITEAKQQAENLKSETLKTTTEEQARIVEQTQKQLAQEKAAMLDSAKAELADIVVQATSTILKEKVDPKKDKQLIDDALQRAQT